VELEVHGNEHEVHFHDYDSSSLGSGENMRKKKENLREMEEEVPETTYGQCGGRRGGRRSPAFAHLVVSDPKLRRSLSSWA
jgi:hypothetical protein